MTIDFNQNYFQLFELECSVSVDQDLLEKKYLNFQKNFHPDKYVNASDYEKRLSLQIISYINEAYTTLKNDYLKSMHLLKIKGYEVDDQNNTISDPGFLTHQIELREEMEDIDKQKDLENKKRFLLKINILKKNSLNKFEEKYNKELFNDALDKIKEMKFYISIENELKKE
tara:strand:- start:104 stop:616 length:513 start_codon:yes stop_codon:yes gene_type:complete